MMRQNRNPATGEEKQAQGTPLKGIKFDLYEVNNTDLTKHAGWVTASKTDLKSLFTDISARTVDSSKVKSVKGHETLITNEKGEAKADNLQPKLYLVVEKPNQKTADGKIVVPTQTFLTTVPMTKPDGSG